MTVATRQRTALHAPAGGRLVAPAIREVLFVFADAVDAALVGQEVDFLRLSKNPLFSGEQVIGDLTGLLPPKWSHTRPSLSGLVMIITREN
jgi:hypothetical protein